jgi:hypothetical protein
VPAVVDDDGHPVAVAGGDGELLSHAREVVLADVHGCA